MTTSYSPSLMGDRYVLPAARGLRRLYLRLFGIPDVRTHLTADYALGELAGLRFDRMLDVGCGNGVVTCLIASRRPCSEIVGIDRDADGVEFAAALARQNGLENVAFRSIDVESSGVAGSFDLVTGFAVMQFIADGPRFVRGINRALRPGGHLLLQLPAARHAVPGKPARSGGYYPEFHEARGPFTADEARSLLTSGGFQIVRMTEVLKGPSVAAKRLFYKTLALSRIVNFALCPILTWFTARDRLYCGPGNGLFVLARKPPNDSPSTPADRDS